ncbi:YdbL family protein [Pelagibius litoralis]|uniref:YdbL family protein n=1 Tax=Pelagibius litoralis TaxID=374515 RepID=A0A967C9R5_9PROT|nr:YdbL family protein [Pelagibius litoralis]NIA67123.1 YdbL family protein [Pelagibius litoralis]
MTRFWSSLFTLLAAIIVALPMLTAPAAAQSLDDLRASGKVGERFDGLAVARDSAFADFVDEVNAKRQAIYAEQAGKQGIPASQVGAVYAQEIIEQVPDGTWILTDQGEWRQK